MIGSASRPRSFRERPHERGGIYELRGADGQRARSRPRLLRRPPCGWLEGREAGGSDLRRRASGRDSPRHPQRRRGVDVSRRRAAIERIGDIVSTTLIVYAVVFASAALIKPVDVVALLIAGIVQKLTPTDMSIGRAPARTTRKPT